MPRQEYPAPKIALIEIDQRCYEARKAGMTYRQIAEGMGISTHRAFSGVRRAGEAIAHHFAEENRAVFQLELERLDAMLVQLWPLTMPHDMTTVSRTGQETTIRVPTNMEAVDRVLKIMDRRAKMLGFDTMQINVTADRRGPVPGAHKTGASGEITPKDEALGLLKVLVKSGVMDPSVLVGAGVLDEETAAEFRAQMDVIDAEVVEDDDENDQLALEDGSAPLFPPEEEEPPPF